jgi:hypothetical protein
LRPNISKQQNEDLLDLQDFEDIEDEERFQGNFIFTEEGKKPGFSTPVTVNN